ncbi:DUF5634 family protein [Metabacillus fastidiosus]|uniref:DUF5634 family protein n=1 Tax=Metabacillus fastidiosus TaxID=1458 RepID=UPI002DB5CD4D|nr:DUF5634 family protein [Metabacillus fastidiosus]MEC2076147.1 DUF5634 family protein [Metabacillus fastidiosus]
MEFLSREAIINELQQSFQSYIDKFDIEAIGIFEEEGQADQYYIGYTVTKNNETFHIHTPYIKNANGDLAPISKEWTVESDDPQKDDFKEYNNLDNLFLEL